MFYEDFRNFLTTINKIKKYYNDMNSIELKAAITTAHDQSVFFRNIRIKFDKCCENTATGFGFNEFGHTFSKHLIKIGIKESNYIESDIIYDEYEDYGSLKEIHNYITYFEKEVFNAFEISKIEELDHPVVNEDFSFLYCIVINNYRQKELFKSTNLNEFYV